DETIRGARMKSPSFTYWLGTDNLGRDLASRIVYGARVSVTVGFASILLATALSTAIGVTSGDFRGIYDPMVPSILDPRVSPSRRPSSPSPCSAPRPATPSPPASAAPEASPLFHT